MAFDPFSAIQKAKMSPASSYQGISHGSWATPGQPFQGFGSSFPGGQGYKPPVDPFIMMNNLIDTQRLNMALSDNPQARIDLAAAGKYYLPAGEPTNDLENLSRRNRLDMALSENPQGRIDIAMGRPQFGVGAVGPLDQQGKRTVQGIK